MKHKRKKCLTRQAPQHCPWKKAYCIGNWREYNAALVKRGSFTLWLNEAAIAGLLNDQHHDGRGAACIYSEDAASQSYVAKSISEYKT
jgi:hypothetical protein